MKKKLPELKARLLQSLFCFRNAMSNFKFGESVKMAEFGVSIAEITVMQEIQNNSPGSEGNIGIAEIQQILYTSKAAVSKMLGVLENKGYINRDINKQNRRTLILTLTPAGMNVLKQVDKDVDKIVEKIISHLGRKQVEHFVSSVNQFSDAMKETVE
ncbi:MAG: MarR family winged helix-turn-helix transcriptional regulator [Spirochaetaceae bacterium]|nr:MarR family winged helix-turn-helix transcriptional regulator [Spirochaetaceae bacterium]